MHHIRSPFLWLLAGACIALAGCDGTDEPAGNTVEMRDMDVIDGTVNDSMTDLDAVKSDGVGAVNNSGSVNRAQTPESVENADAEDTETVPAE